ncbi:unnamed protein product [Ceratitis capitata]|uniref:(Mediterranean fruit fly) hypothetical protein n=1 Tax=Ceratitis capitata TaxID=7213 RepID=A0A811URF6_CERCA|nr:unnamed protein product [Ceratitis capitata]
MKRNPRTDLLKSLRQKPGQIETAGPIAGRPRNEESEQKKTVTTKKTREPNANKQLPSTSIVPKTVGHVKDVKSLSPKQSPRGHQRPFSLILQMEAVMQKLSKTTSRKLNQVKRRSKSKTHPPGIKKKQTANQNLCETLKSTLKVSASVADLKTKAAVEIRDIDS